MSDDDLLAALPARKPAGGNPGILEGAGMGLARGVKDVIDTGAHALASGFDSLMGTKEADRIKASDAAGAQAFEQRYGDSTAASIGRVGGQVLATAPIGGAAGALVKGGAAVGALPKGAAALGDAIASGGIGGSGAGVATRMAGGAINGGLTSAAVDPSTVDAGAGIGAALPALVSGAGRVGQAVGAAVAPFTRSGQDGIVGKTMRSMATDPDAAAAAMRAASEVIPGSIPTAAAASGDVGLSGLQRGLINKSPSFASDMAARTADQNAARTAALEAIAGNEGKISLAEEARDAATAAMREDVLARAGVLDAKPMQAQLDAMLKDPNNAGLLSRKAIRDFKKQLNEVSVNGSVDSRALYALRKDLNDILGGKLQGESGNLKYASGQLIGIKGMIDDAIDMASNRVPMASGTSLGAPQSQLAGAQSAAVGQAAPSWRGYLSTYADMSKPIEQMKALQDVFKSIQTGTVDTAGRPIISPAMLNNQLKNKLPELKKKLTEEQIQVLRNLQADLNAATLANNAGRAVGSNTVQNLAGDQMINGLLGSAGNATPIKSLVGNVMRLPYARANEMVENRLAEAMLDPQVAAKLMTKAEKKSALERMRELPAAANFGRAFPVLANPSLDR
ncbi:hypothetical protein PSQ40_04975 [Curvibacter sp. HBC61]|uniref:DNA transfer protein n=1 Tax=Curvibacter cyanobacteriorum TaxID=3026422 RepID=A0ABT5MV41_9BURK|nr:hypothetical protein [Curvibacter sp. HBC61]MDD0837919.1 hypothetical protein [Curvibacter sp. HBC61]